MPCDPSIVECPLQQLHFVICEGRWIAAIQPALRDSSTGCGFVGGVRPVPPEKGIFPLDHMHECDLEKKDYINCIKSSGHKSEQCRLFSKKYLECCIGKINTCNGFYCDTFLAKQSEKSKMWTENWTGCDQVCFTASTCDNPFDPQGFENRYFGSYSSATRSHSMPVFSGVRAPRIRIRENHQSNSSQE
ncbi:hypothetical protein L1049_026057 [Liquidambar formosana]|uniref:Uncharacterized protein n=1 Tax=Liquidambar formosana TaxID=63359 RepID=A0AAP0R552_LIQFO